jgi:uncharacterized short protein YbdD (DUF466 family)
MWRRRMRKRWVGGHAGRWVDRPITHLPTYPPTLGFRLRSAFKQIAGMPDYARYLEHARAQHPDCRLLSEREFYDRFISGRYASGGSRCC